MARRSTPPPLADSVPIEDEVSKTAPKRKAKAAKVSVTDPIPKQGENALSSIQVKTVKPFKMFCSRQNILILPNTITQVANDHWVQAQIQAGTLTEV